MLNILLQAKTITTTTMLLQHLDTMQLDQHKDGRTLYLLQHPGKLSIMLHCPHSNSSTMHHITINTNHLHLHNTINTTKQLLRSMLTSLLIITTTTMVVHPSPCLHLSLVKHTMEGGGLLLCTSSITLWIILNINNIIIILNLCEGSRTLDGVVIYSNDFSLGRRDIQMGDI